MLGTIHFTGNDDYHNFVVFAPILNLVTFDNKKITNWISAEVLPEKINPFNPSIALFMSDLSSRVSIKFNNSVLVQKNFLHCIATPF